MHIIIWYIKLKPFIVSIAIEIMGVYISLLNDGFWFRVKKWKDAGYWITWSSELRFGERFGYEKPIWVIGYWKYGEGFKYRLACFTLEAKTNIKEENVKEDVIVYDKLRLVK